MRALASLLICFLILPTHASSKEAAIRPFTQQNQNYMNGLLKRCDGGDGQSCFDYAESLKLWGRESDKKRIIYFTRRGCTLAYMPACNIPEKPQKARFVSKSPSCGVSAIAASGFTAIYLPDGRSGLQISNVGKGSLLEKSGLRAGDVLTKVNGVNFTTTTQISQALENGGAMLEVARGPSIIPFTITCPKN
ncbi:MAG: PDZ domain-containing protein [Bdellovibrionales bacterium]|nr:PDZ domain-containing protein [Bdellovibrionales bacterium]